MKTQMDKLIGYQGGSVVSIDPSQRRGQVTPLPQVISTGPPLSPDVEKEYRPPTEEGSMTIQPVFPTVGSPEYERYLQAIQNLPEGGLESLPRISEEPERYTPGVITPTTELSPGGPDTSFVGGKDPSLVVLGLINKDSTPADVMGYLGYVNSESNQAPITLNDVVTTATNAVDFGDTTAGKILGKVTEGKSGLLSFLIGSLFGEKGPSGDATTEQALAIVERAQRAEAHQSEMEGFQSKLAQDKVLAQQEATYGLSPASAAAQVSGPSAPSTPSGTIASPFAGGQPALSTGAASPQRSGGLVQNMYDGGVVRMAEGGVSGARGEGQYMPQQPTDDEGPPIAPPETEGIPLDPDADNEEVYVPPPTDTDVGGGAKDKPGDSVEAFMAGRDPNLVGLALVTRGVPVDKTIKFLKPHATITSGTIRDYAKATEEHPLQKMIKDITNILPEQLLSLTGLVTSPYLTVLQGIVNFLDTRDLTPEEVERTLTQHSKVEADPRLKIQRKIFNLKEGQDEAGGGGGGFSFTAKPSGGGPSPAQMGRRRKQGGVVKPMYDGGLV